MDIIGVANINLSLYNMGLHDIYNYATTVKIYGQGFLVGNPHTNGNLMMHMLGDGAQSLVISAGIVNNGNKLTGLHVINKSNTRKSVTIDGNSGNTYTGQTVISGAVDVSLNKQSGQAISGFYIMAENGATIHLLRSGQMYEGAQLGLINASLVIHGQDIVQRVKTLAVGLSVKNTSSVIDFDNTLGGRKYFYAEVLSISGGGSLDLRNWQEDLDFFLLRKTDFNLKNLSNVKVNGWHKAMIKDYDQDYWQVGVFLPEPATYGAILGALGLGIVIFRKARRKSVAKHRCGLVSTYAFLP